MRYKYTLQICQFILLIIAIIISILQWTHVWLSHNITKITLDGNSTTFDNLQVYCNF